MKLRADVIHVRINSLGNFEGKKSKFKVTGAKKGEPHIAFAIEAALCCL